LQAWIAVAALLPSALVALIFTYTEIPGPILLVAVFFPLQLLAAGIAAIATKGRQGAADSVIIVLSVAILPVFEAFNAFVPTAALPVTYGDDGAEEELIAFPDDPQLAKIGSGAMTLSVEDQGNIAATPAVGGIPDDEIFDLAASKIILQEDQPVVGWPVLGTGHLLVCDDPADPLPLSVAQYSLRLAGQGALETYGLTPLPEPVRIKTFEPLKVTVAGEN
jgi:hypothetical protein